MLLTTRRESLSVCVDEETVEMTRYKVLLGFTVWIHQSIVRTNKHIGSTMHLTASVYPWQEIWWGKVDNVNNMEIW